MTKIMYIGRRGIVFIDGKRFPNEDSPFANPFKIGRDGTRDQVLKKYAHYLKTSPKLLEKVGNLKGKNLGCWCHPEPCHGNIIESCIS